MIKRIQAKNYRSLKYIDVSVEDFQVLIGPNASGKTTFLDVVAFVSDFLDKGIDDAVGLRTSNFDDLTFGGKGGDIELALELEIPEDIRQTLGDQRFKRIRYEIALGQQDGLIVIQGEAVVLIDPEFEVVSTSRSLFPEYATPPRTILINGDSKNKSKRNIVKKKRGGNDNFYSETQEKAGKGWMPSFHFGNRKSALVNLPADETKFPASTWLKEFLINGTQSIVLDSLNIRKASGPGQGKNFMPDGSNLPWVIEDLKSNNQDRFWSWLDHVRTALPDIKDVRPVLREDDKHMYLKVLYDSGIEVPSWMVSDGTLRLLALTILPYLKDFQGVFLIEEPENGIHPQAVETIFQSLSSVYDAQIMIASHSPVFLSMVQAKQLLCFAKTKEGITDIVNGQNHPLLKEWKSSASLSNLFASGVLS